MLPPSWKSDIQKSIEEEKHADAEKREAQQNNTAAKIAAAIKTISDAQSTQTTHEDSNQKVNVTLNGITIFLVLLTVIFTGGSWYVFHQQLTEMQKVYVPIEQSADAAARAADAAVKSADVARQTLIVGQRAYATFLKMEVVHNGSSWSINPRWQNTGATYAKKLQLWSNTTTLTVFDADSFLTAPPRNEFNSVADVSPKMPFAAPPIVITVNFIKDWVSRSLRTFAGSGVFYHDSFEGTPEHSCAVWASVKLSTTDISNIETQATPFVFEAYKDYSYCD